MVLLTAALLALIYEYLTNKYFYGLAYTPIGGEPVFFVLSEKLFAWFVTGTIFGAVMLFLVFEGEFVLGLVKLARAIESEAEKGLLKFEKGFEKGLTKEARAVRRGVQALAAKPPKTAVKPRASRRKTRI